MSDKRKARTVAETPTHSPVGGGPGSGSRPASEQDAPVIVSNVPGSFARGVLANRHPALIEQVRDAFPYGPRQHEALDALLDANNNGVIEPLAPSESDQELWWGWGRELFGRSWFDAPFLWAESYFYRRLLGAVGYFGAGPWQGVDPFAPFKRAELRGTAVDEELRALDALAGVPADERATALLHASVRGNRADLGFRVTEGDTAAGAA
ncbi:protein-glutamate O-methyltransferase family protein, partial [Streptomyces sp. SID8455]|nr:protein-glutamate O-methyltransferase family protein [Streptomyces sp. SID8455]